MFLARTIQDLLEKIEGKTEIIAVLDGAWADPEIPQDPRVTVLYFPKSIGQRAATNQGVRLSSAKYVAKVDAHCSFDKGFDVKLMADMQDDWTMVPTMKNLHAFDWVCPDGHRRYQGPSGVCAECGKETTRDILWHAKRSPNSRFFRFDTEPHFQYWGAFEERDGGKEELAESMSLQGSFFMCTREKYWELGLSDESWGSWGQQGIEVALKTWLSGGRVISSNKTWYAHMFRTQGGDFGFPYQNEGKGKALTKSQEMIADGWDKAKIPFADFVKKFDPPEWGGTKGVVWFSDMELDPKIMKACQEQLRKAFKGKIVSVTLKPCDFGDVNVQLDIKRGKEALFKQILAGLEALDTDYVFLCDHDCLYPPSHFDFTPPRRDTFYYNLNWWRVRTTDGLAVHWDGKQSNLICADRKLMVDEYRQRVEVTEKEGWQHRGWEPGTRSIRRGGFNDRPSGTWKSKESCLDLRHGGNLTGDKWKKEDFRDPKYSKGWNERYDKGWLESSFDMTQIWQPTNNS